jgi:hypothetical protein
VSTVLKLTQSQSQSGKKRCQHVNSTSSGCQFNERGDKPNQKAATHASNNQLSETKSKVQESYKNRSRRTADLRQCQSQKKVYSPILQTPPTSSLSCGTPSVSTVLKLTQTQSQSGKKPCQHVNSSSSGCQFNGRGDTLNQELGGELVTPRPLQYMYKTATRISNDQLSETNSKLPADTVVSTPANEVKSSQTTPITTIFQHIIKPHSFQPPTLYKKTFQERNCSSLTLPDHLLPNSSKEFLSDDECPSHELLLTTCDEQSSGENLDFQTIRTSSDIADESQAAQMSQESDYRSGNIDHLSNQQSKSLTDDYLSSSNDMDFCTSQQLRLIMSLMMRASIHAFRLAVLMMTLYLIPKMTIAAMEVCMSCYHKQNSNHLICYLFLA